jgi:hypothetical protein
MMSILKAPGAVLSFRADDIAGPAASLLVENLEAVKPGARSNAGKFFARFEAGAGNQSGDMCPVAIVVPRTRLHAAAGEVPEPVNVGGEVFRRIDAGIHHGDADSRAVERQRIEAKGLTQDVDGGRFLGPPGALLMCGKRRDFRVDRYSEDRVIRFEGRQVLAMQGHGEGIEGRVLSSNDVSMRRERVLERHPRARPGLDDDPMHAALTSCLAQHPIELRRAALCEGGDGNAQEAERESEHGDGASGRRFHGDLLQSKARATMVGLGSMCAKPFQKWRLRDVPAHRSHTNRLPSWSDPAHLQALQFQV